MFGFKKRNPEKNPLIDKRSAKTPVNKSSINEESTKITQIANVDKTSQDVPSPADVDGNSPLHTAVLKQDLEAIMKLVADGANVNALNDYRYTPLHYAAELCDVDIAVVLITKGANVNALARRRKPPNYPGYYLTTYCLPLTLLIETQNMGKEKEKIKEFAQLLIENGADFETRVEFSIPSKGLKTGTVSELAESAVAIEVLEVIQEKQREERKNKSVEALTKRVSDLEEEVRTLKLQNANANNNVKEDQQEIKKGVDFGLFK